MFLFYFDESGDSGHPKLVKTPTKFFVLSGVIVHQDSWRPSLDKLIRLRRDLRDQFGLRIRGEIKGKDFHRGRGAFAGLGIREADRLSLYRRLMQFQRNELSELVVFSIAIDKSKLNDTTRDIRTIAWQYALQRVDRHLEPSRDRTAPGDLGMIFPDHGHGQMIRKLLRQVRRHQRIPGFYGGVLNIPTDRIVEDPNERNSEESYFVQLADWNALACHRSKHIDPNNTIPDDLWDELGDIRSPEVNRLRGGPCRGIVKWP